MKRWIDIGSDVSWYEYGGKWAKKGRDGAWYVVRFENMYEACGESDCKSNDTPQYLAEALIVDLRDLSADAIASALKCCGMRILKETPAEIARPLEDAIVSDSGDIIAEKDSPNYETVLVEACVSYGQYAPVGSESGHHRPVNVRAAARRICETLMRDAAAKAAAMAKPVNKIGSTAHEYMTGDLNAALDRGPFDTGKNLMRKLHGLPPVSE